ncbi:MAG: OFA family MFS transporter [Alphaproteobacteria bacterium]|nr:OFA family MFS transporter [Alphaproteobacteria bacterium]
MSFLKVKNLVADAKYNRWRFPPSALAIHLCIGMAYGFSVFWKPLSKLLTVDPAMVDACKAQTLLDQLFTTSCNWTEPNLGWMYSIFFIFLGSSAAVFGRWVEKVGPRMAGMISAILWCSGFFISTIGIVNHQLWMLWLGSGVIGGIGLGLGYISPVSTLVKWFPDKRGMATGLAIMGFGGGAMIGSPLAELLMKSVYGTQDVPGIYQTFLTMGVIYAVFMVSGALSYRVPPQGWAPKGWTAPTNTNNLVSKASVHVNNAHKTPQFWLIWLVLCLNVSAGIGVLGMASPMFQEILGGNPVGRAGVALTELTSDEAKIVAGIAAGLTGLLSLFNILGRIFWASSSDKFGRKNTYFIFFILGMILYASLPTLAHTGNEKLFVLFLCIILSMYGGGFATVPAYLADVFGTQFVGAIHGRLLTAWSVAGVVGAVVVNYLREAQKTAGVPAVNFYDTALYVLALMLVGGLIANFLVRPVNSKFHMSDAEVKKLMEERNLANVTKASDIGQGKLLNDWRALVGWIAVGIPLLWGASRALQSALKIFY